jgi:hypothetical protein
VRGLPRVLLALRVVWALVSLVPEACREGVCQAALTAARVLGAVSLQVSCREPVQRWAVLPGDRSARAPVSVVG